MNQENNYGVVRQSLKLVEEDYGSLEGKVIVLPSPPENMSYEAKCEFLRSIENVVEMGIYSGPNIGLYESYCIATGYARECEQILEVDGKIIGAKAHPAYRMMLDAMSTARSIWAELKPKKIVLRENEEEESEWKKDKSLLA